MSRELIELGYEVGTGRPVGVPLAHTAVTGQTQASGKTTTLEAMISRGGAMGLHAVAFVTKRGEGGFSGGSPLPAYFRERADWRFVESVLEAAMRERMKYERGWIIRASKGAKTLADVQHNVQQELKRARGLAANMFLQLNEYLEIVVPQIEALDYTDNLVFGPGLNVMDLGGYSTELQGLVIRSVLESVYEEFTKTVCILPEAWEFIPQNRGSPVKLAAESLIRKGAALKNFVWIDAQDIGALHKDIIRSIGLWILGVQREANEIERMLKHIPVDNPKPRAKDIATLERGQFYVCHGGHVIKTYVRPAWMSVDEAIAIATGRTHVTDVIRPEGPARPAAAPSPAPRRRSPQPSKEPSMLMETKAPEATKPEPKAPPADPGRDEAVAALREELRAARAELAAAKGVIEAVKTTLAPQYQMLQKLFGELGSVTAGGADAGVYAPWIAKLGGGGAKVLEALVQHGSKTTPQLATLTGLAQRTVLNNLKTLRRNGLVTSQGGAGGGHSLRPLS